APYSVFFLVLTAPPQISPLSLHDALPIFVRADQGRLAQSLLNLVVNARTHTPPGTRVRVTAAVEDGGVEPPDGGWLVLAVEDDGDRKSTRLNSSHVKISYAVFCLKKKKHH